MKEDSPEPTLDQRLNMSSGEERIAAAIDQYGIPFFYKQPAIVYDQEEHRVWRPSFTLPSYGGTIVDYISASQGLTNQQGIDYRQQVYRYNQIPAVLLGPQDLMKGNWDQTLYSDIKRELENMYAEHFRADPAKSIAPRD